MNISQFIKNDKDLNKLPFLIVFRTIQVLIEKGMIKGIDDVDRIQS